MRIGEYLKIGNKMKTARMNAAIQGVWQKNYN